MATKLQVLCVPDTATTATLLFNKLFQAKKLHYS